jgi:hypothetical protein
VKNDLKEVRGGIQATITLRMSGDDGGARDTRGLTLRRD